MFGAVTLLMLGFGCASPIKEWRGSKYLIDQHGKTPKAFAIPAHQHVSREKVRAEEFKQIL
jgi:hypothetical protein